MTTELDQRTLDQSPEIDDTANLRAKLEEDYGDDSDEEDEEWLDFVAIPPDGGWGWMVVFASFMANMVVDGISYSFGVFLPKFQLHYKSSQGLTAMVGSLLTGCYLIVGPIVGGLVNRFGARIVMIVGSIIGTVSFFISAFAPSLTILLITYGVIGGIGFGFIYLPAIVHVGYYFEKKRALATGIAVSGSGAGTFIFAPLSVAILDAYAWKGALWILCGFILNCAVFGALLRPLKPKKSLEEFNKKVEEEAQELAEKKASVRSLSNKFEGNPPSYSQQHSGDSTGRIQNTNRDSLAPREASESSQGNEDMPMDFANPTPHYLEALQEEQGELSGTKLLPILTASPKVLEPQAGRGPYYSRDRTHSSNTQQDRRGSIIRHSESSRASFGRPGSRLTARSYLSSLQRLNSVQNVGGVGVSASMSAHNLGTIDPNDFNRPLYRRDIFYSGSIRNLPAFVGSSSSPKVGAYLESTISVPGALGDLTDETPLEEYRYCRWLPRSVRNACFGMLDVRLFKEPVMVLLCLSNIFGMLGFYVPFVYLTNRAEDYEVEPGQAAFLLSIIGITNTLGRVVFGWVADQGWVTALTINNVCLMSCGLLTLIVPFLTTYASMAAYSAIFGFLISAYISLTSIILVDYLGLEQLTNSFGLLILSRGLSAMIGSPIAGAVYDSTQSYNDSFYFGGGLITVAGLVSCFIPIVYRVQAYLNPAETPPKKLSTV